MTTGKEWGVEGGHGKGRCNVGETMKKGLQGIGHTEKK